MVKFKYALLLNLNKDLFFVYSRLNKEQYDKLPIEIYNKNWLLKSG